MAIRLASPDAAQPARHPIASSQFTAPDANGRAAEHAGMSSTGPDQDADAVAAGSGGGSSDNRYTAVTARKGS
jgi:hypothetical protein